MQGSTSQPLSAETVAQARQQQISQGGIPVVPLIDGSSRDLGSIVAKDGNGAAFRLSGSPGASAAEQVPHSRPIRW